MAKVKKIHLRAKGGKIHSGSLWPFQEPPLELAQKWGKQKLDVAKIQEDFSLYLEMLLHVFLHPFF